MTDSVPTPAQRVTQWKERAVKSSRDFRGAVRGGKQATAMHEFGIQAALNQCAEELAASLQAQREQIKARLEVLQDHFGCVPLTDVLAVLDPKET